MTKCDTGASISIRATYRYGWMTMIDTLKRLAKLKVNLRAKREANDPRVASLVEFLRLALEQVSVAV